MRACGGRRRRVSRRRMPSRAALRSPGWPPARRAAHAAHAARAAAAPAAAAVAIAASAAAVLPPWAALVHATAATAATLPTAPPFLPTSAATLPPRGCDSARRAAPCASDHERRQLVRLPTRFALVVLPRGYAHHR